MSPVTYLCSERTMYRILEENQESRERRDQLRHPKHKAPELLATRPHSSLEEVTPAAFMESKKTGLATGHRSDALEVPKGLGTPELTPRLS